tara:strand:+ start:3631 stop:3849 length:219 start_codon:yes stop_codon:yes gene_type:complete
MNSNIIGKLGKPRMNLIKALCSEKYGEKNWSADEINTVIHENELHLYASNGRIRTEGGIKRSMKDAFKKLQP